MISEALSDSSVPVLVLDIKGDLSGLGAHGVINDKITERCKVIGIDYKPSAYPVEFLTLSNEKGANFGLLSVSSVPSYCLKSSN